MKPDDRGYVINFFHAGKHPDNFLTLSVGTGFSG